MAASIFVMKSSFALMAMVAILLTVYSGEAQVPNCSLTDLPGPALFQTEATCLALMISNNAAAFATQCCPRIQALNFNCLCYLPIPINLLALRQYARRCTITVPSVGLCAVPIP